MKKERKILVAICSLDQTGAPRSTKDMCAMLIKNGFSVDLWSWLSGTMENEFLELGITPRIVPPDTLENLEREILKYDLIIANTICTHQIVQLYQEVLPIMWIIHEAGLLSSFLIRNPERHRAFLRANNLYSVSEYAAGYIERNYHLTPRVIHNYVEDYSQLPERGKKKKRKLSFLALGTIYPWKRTDIFIRGYTTMEPSYQNRCQLHFAGNIGDTMYFNGIMKEISPYEGIIYHGEIKEREALYQLIADSDVVVVPSKDEACSLVVLEAAMMGKPIIAGEQVGPRDVLDAQNSWSFESGNVEELRRIYEKIINNPGQLAEMGRHSHQKYLETSTPEIYEKRLISEVERNLSVDKIAFQKENQFLRKKYQYSRKFSDNPFPYKEIEKGSRVILYGAGAVGEEWYKSLKKSCYCKVELWVDKNYMTLEPEVENPEKIVNTEYDFILVAVEDDGVFKEIKEYLTGWGIGYNLIFQLKRR